VNIPVQAHSKPTFDVENDEILMPTNALNRTGKGPYKVTKDRARGRDIHGDANGCCNPVEKYEDRRSIN
jgi:hypothetical protein